MDEPGTRPVPSRRNIAILAVPMLAFAIASNVGNALAPTLIANEPSLLLVLSPRLRWLVLIAPEINVFAFYAVPLLRAAALLAVYYLLGRWYGDRSVRWLEDRARNTVRPLLWMERKFHQARYPMVFAFPGTLVALLAGCRRHRAPRVPRRRAVQHRDATRAGPLRRERVPRSARRRARLDQRAPALAHRRVDGHRVRLGAVVQPARLRADGVDRRPRGRAHPRRRRDRRGTRRPS